MKVIYEKEISAIKDWLQRTNAQLSTGALPAFLQTDCWKIQNELQTISTNIQYEYPFYGHELLEIKNILFSAPQPPYGMMLLNSAAFGELFIIIKHISSEPIDTRFWQDIHPRIIAVSKGLFCDGHFAAACEAAIKEVETRMRELFKEGKPNSPIPKDAAGLIGVILSRLVDTFISKISLTMLPVPKPHNTACVLSWEEARRWQSRSSGYSSS